MATEAEAAVDFVVNYGGRGREGVKAGLKLSSEREALSNFVHYFLASFFLC